MADNLFDKVYNPDVLSCLANLSNDEVFTPPDVANKMLDMLPQELFSNPNTTFLDPACKSGVFLREIAKRLIKGLEKVIPDLQARLDHIFHKQLYGIAITEMTSLLSRRSVYCSKYPNSKYSVSKFDDVEGNIRYKNIAHSWVNGKCKYCGASKSEYGGTKRDGMETHAYEWIHVDDLEEIFGMKFDVIVGNPPYQLNTGGSIESQALPIYQKFIIQSKKLNPRYTLMIIPSRWMNGGFGLDDFRDEMLNDHNIRVLYDFIDANDCFAGISLSGGVCYFLRDRDNEGLCNIYTNKGNNQVSHSKRYLLEPGFSTYIRFNEALSILKKVKKLGEDSFDKLVSPRDPFGLNYYENGSERMFKKFSPVKGNNDCEIYYFGWQRTGIQYANKSYITTRKDSVHKYKVFISKANGAASNKIPYTVLSKPFVAKPGSICNMTYLMIGPFDSYEEANNVEKYIATKFFRFLVSMKKNTQNALKKVYELVPMQDFTKEWNDETLYQKYGLNAEEIEVIESMIKPMDVGSDLNG